MNLPECLSFFRFVLFLSYPYLNPVEFPVSSRGIQGRGSSSEADSKGTDTKLLHEDAPLSPFPSSQVTPSSLPTREGLETSSLTYLKRDGTPFPRSANTANTRHSSVVRVLDPVPTGPFFPLDPPDGHHRGRPSFTLHFLSPTQKFSPYLS